MRHSDDKMSCSSDTDKMQYGCSSDIDKMQYGAVAQICIDKMRQAQIQTRWLRYRQDEAWV